MRQYTAYLFRIYGYILGILSMKIEIVKFTLEFPTVEF